MNETNQSISYDASLPSEIRYDKNLTNTEKIIYLEIRALCGKGYCWAKNSHFTEHFSVSERQLTRIITKLKNDGYIRVEYTEGDTSKRRIYMPSIKIKKDLTPVSTPDISVGSDLTPVSTPLNIMYYNEKYNERDGYVFFVSLFNKITNRKFKPDYAKTYEKFKARIKEGFTLEEMENAVKSASKNDFLVNGGYLTIEYILRNDKLQQHLNLPENKKVVAPTEIQESRYNNFTEYLKALKSAGEIERYEQEKLRLPAGYNI